MRNHEVRHARIEAEAANYIASQIRVIRQQRGMTQAALAKKLKTTQTAVSRLEDPSYGRYSVQLLLAVGKALDVALLVKYVPFNKLLTETHVVREETFALESIEEELAHIQYFTISENKSLTQMVATINLQTHQSLQKIPKISSVSSNSLFVASTRSSVGSELFVSSKFVELS